MCVSVCVCTYVYKFMLHEKIVQTFELGDKLNKFKNRGKKVLMNLLEKMYARQGNRTLCIRAQIRI